MFRKQTNKPERFDAPELLEGMAYEDAATDEKFLIKGGRRYRFISNRAFESWKLPLVRISSVDLLVTTESGGVLGFRDSTLLENIADGRLYIISANKRRHIRNPDWLFEYGLLDGTVVQVSNKEIQVHEEGEPLD